jgi:DNA-binding response OmpR family regulator
MAFGRDEDRRCGQEAGFDHYLVKPADPKQLLIHTLDETVWCVE